MKSAMFIHNDDVKCFHVAIQGTQKVVVMGCNNFEDEALIKRWWASQKMNEMNKRLKDENKQSNHWKLFSFVTRSYERILSFGVHRSMSVESAIKKLQRKAKEKETQNTKQK